MRPHQQPEVRRILDAAIDLEQELSQRLRNMGIEHLLTWSSPTESPHVDLRVFHHSGNPEQDLEIRLTLGTKTPRRLRAFVRDSIQTVERGIRVYLEICATILQSLEIIVDRVARTIRDIAHRYRDFGPNRLIGVRVYASPHSHRMERVDLIRRAHLHASSFSR